MKIIKKNKVFLESDQQDPKEVLDELNVKTDDVVDLDDASNTEIVADMAAGAKDANKAIDVEEAEDAAEEVEEIAKLIVNPYGTAQPKKLKWLLQQSLETALIQRMVGDEGDFPNILIYGLAGFGKTSIVKQFCREHNIYLFECDAKNLDPATISGIPYATQDMESGEYSQAPINSKYWDSLDDNGHEYSILFLDELNRANSRSIGSLLTLINEHTIPAYVEDRKRRKSKVTKKFNNVLFSVIAVNPASDVFPDVIPLDGAVISRNTAVYEQEADKAEFLDVVTDMYNKILNIKNLAPEIAARYAGQRDLAKAILNSNLFKFDDIEKVRDKYTDGLDQAKIYNPVNYRSLMLQLKGCNGTKDNFLQKIRYSGMGKEAIDMFNSILSSYKDKVTVGNSIFGAGVGDPKYQRSSQEAAKILRDFVDNLPGLM